LTVPARHLHHDPRYSFVYGPGGERVKGTMDGVTTLCVGTHFEKILSGVEAGTERKYYYAGSQRKRERGGNGALQGMGEERYSSETVPTTFRYTGQRHETHMASAVKIFAGILKILGGK
jgi:hypothetical protein